jgi:putative endonuclease
MAMAKPDGEKPKRAPRVKPPPAPERVAAFNTGLTAEARAEEFLQQHGYRILARRFRTRYGEIDIVAQAQRLVAFVEVKARARIDDAAYAVTPRQQARIIDAARAWLMTHPEHGDFELRFDALLIAPGRPPCHLLAAFDASA